MHSTCPLSDYEKNHTVTIMELLIRFHNKFHDNSTLFEAWWTKICIHMMSKLEYESAWMSLQSLHTKLRIKKIVGTTCNICFPSNAVIYTVTVTRNIN
jgi:hypothetical protein